MCVAPYYVASKMSKIRATSWSIPSADDYSASVLKQVIKNLILDESSMYCLVHKKRDNIKNTTQSQEPA